MVNVREQDDVMQHRLMESVSYSLCVEMKGRLLINKKEAVRGYPGLFTGNQLLSNSRGWASFVSLLPDHTMIPPLQSFSSQTGAVAEA